MYRKFLHGVLFCLFQILVFNTGLLPAQSSPQLTFDRANDKLESGAFREALTDYRQLEQNDYSSGALFLNMAFSYVQLDSLGKAKYYFLKGRSFDETKTRAEAGLEYVNAQFPRQSAVLPKLPWEQFFDWLNETFGPEPVAAAGILFLNVGIFTFVGYWFYRRHKKFLYAAGITLAGLGIILLLAGFFLSYLDHRYSTAVMVSAQTTVIERPQSEATIISQAYEGYTFTVDHRKSREYPGWTYVRMSNGLYGWIPRKDILIL